MDFANIVFFHWKSFKFLYGQVHLTIFLYLLDLQSYSRTTQLPLCDIYNLLDFLLRFLNYFIVDIHIFNPSGIHPVNSLRFRSNVIFPLMDGQLCQHHFLIQPTFSHWLGPTYLSHIKFLCLLGSISGFPILAYWVFYLLLY